jgi:hypothetical protein
MEYKTIFHTIDDDLDREVDSMSERGWYIKQAFEPTQYENSEEYYILIIWERAIQLDSVSKRIFIVEILEKEKGWNAISINLDTFDEAQSFFDDHKTDYFHGEIRIVQVYVC